MEAPAARTTAPVADRGVSSGRSWTPETPRSTPGIEAAAARGQPRPPAAPGTTPLVAKAAATTARARGLAHDLVPGRRNRIPEAAECVDALAARVTGILVARVGVERVAIVGDLRLTVGPRSCSEHRGICPAAGRRLATGAERWPRARAGARAHALRPRVLLEQVERAPLGIDQDRAEAASVRGADRCCVSGHGLGRRSRRGCAATATATCGDAQRDERYRRRAGDEGDGSAASHSRSFRFGESSIARVEQSRYTPGPEIFLGRSRFRGRASPTPRQVGTECSPGG